jgi:hypothetical protein
MKVFKKIYYFIIFHFRYALIRNYSTNRQLYILLIYLESVGIKSIHLQRNDARYFIIFNDNTTLEFWNNNRWYAWMSEGKIKFSNGKILSWSSEMPSPEVLIKYIRIIRALEKKKQNEDFEQYLPIKVLRKNKLKKLNKIN